MYQFFLGNHHIDKISTEEIKQLLSAMDNEQRSSVLELLASTKIAIDGDWHGTVEDVNQYLLKWTAQWKREHDTVSDTSAVEDVQRAQRDFTDKLVDKGFLEFGRFLMSVAQQVPK